jgi:hypothetical protein
MNMRRPPGTVAIAALSLPLLLLLGAAFRPAVAQERRVAGELGGGIFSLTFGEGPDHAQGLFFNLALMGRNLGVEAAVFPGLSDEPVLFAGNLILSTNSSARVSAFVSAGLPVPVEAVLLGAGVRFRVTPRFSLIGRGILWLTYEGGPMFLFGGVYRF